jgi:hypothetical protein
MNIHDTFADGALPYWNRFAVGRAWIVEQFGALRFVLGPVKVETLPATSLAQALSDVELNDHRLYERGRWPWRPPLRLMVRARASHGQDQLLGTAGFGFWNAPFGAGNAAADSPQAVWFFHASPPSFMSMSNNGAGNGWRAQVLNAPRVPKFIVLLGGLAWYVLKPLRPLFYRAAQTQVGGGEVLISASLTEWHTYRLDWLRDQVDFFVDEQKIFTSHSSPRGALGFVAWLDNSMLSVRDGDIRFGNLDVPERQWFELSEVKIEGL